jgi:hypothetical protein
MHQTQKNGEAARCISPNRYSIVKVQEPESRVHRKVQARVREGADENVPQGNASAAYFTIFLNVQGQGMAFRSQRTPMGAAFPEKPCVYAWGVVTKYESAYSASISWSM